MKSMCKIWIVLLFALILVCEQRVCGDANDLAAESLSLLKEIKTINTRKKEATSGQTKRITKIESKLK